LTGLYAKDIQEICQFIGIFDIKNFFLEKPNVMRPECSFSFLEYNDTRGKAFIGGKIHPSAGEIHPLLSFLFRLEFAPARDS